MPAKFRDIIRVLREYDVQVQEPSKGSHWRALGTRNGRPTSYPIPAHNGPKTEISDVYIRGACRAFGLSETEFFARLHGK